MTRLFIKVFFYVNSKLKGLRWKFQFKVYKEIFKGRVTIPDSVQGETPEFLFDGSQSFIILGESVSFRGRSFFLAHRSAEIVIGDRVFFNRGCSVNALGSIRIGARCLFGERVSIWDHDHDFSDSRVSIVEQGYTVKSVKIGDDCWIGAGAVVLKGVSIGERSVIGAGSVVTKDVPSGEIWAGIPAKMVGRREDRTL